jgi:hypothetical protein
MHKLTVKSKSKQPLQDDLVEKFINLLCIATKTSIAKDRYLCKKISVIFNDFESTQNISDVEFINQLASLKVFFNKITQPSCLSVFSPKYSVDNESEAFIMLSHIASIDRLDQKAYDKLQRFVLDYKGIDFNVSHNTNNNELSLKKD